MKKRFLLIGASGWLFLILAIASFRQPDHNRERFIVNVEKVRATQVADLSAIAVTTADMVLVIDRALTIANGTIPLPANPIDGQIFTITTRTTITNLTLNTNGITIYGGIVTLSANTRVGWIFDQASNAWFPY